MNWPEVLFPLVISKIDPTLIKRVTNYIQANVYKIQVDDFAEIFSQGVWVV